jgi:hypothetical protein
MSVKKGDTVVLAGTKKGLFVLHSRDRRRWKSEGPYFEGMPIYHATSDGKTLHASATNDHWGPAVRRSTSWGARWAKDESAPAYAKATGLSVERVWNLTRGEEGTLYAGVEPAGLFASRDDGKTWQSVEGFNAQKARKDWMPGGGGLCLHTILPYPGDARRMVVAASAVGIFGTNDAGTSWRLMNGGIAAPFLPAGKTDETMLGSCPHKLVRDARDPALLYMQNHAGVYKRRRGDAAWTPIMKGLPSPFGFPMAAHPHDAGTVYTMPLESDMNRVTGGGAPAVYRTRDEGKSWTRLAKGWPKESAWLTVLREGMATDGKDPAGVYVGTTTGQLYASRDEGDSWKCIAQTLPPVLSVSTTVAR